MEKIIKITDPCSENWNKMKIGLISRHCETCNKDVMDFTKMSREKILEYLFTHRKESVCGRLLKSQLDISYSELVVSIQSISQKTKNTNLGFYLLSLGALLFSNYSEAQSIERIPSEISCSEDSAKIVSPKILPENENIPIPPPFPNHEIMGGIQIITPPATEEPVLMGDITIQEPESVAEIMPEFPGGIDSLTQYIIKNLAYPEWERKKRIQGIVTVSFIIDKQGIISHPKIIRTVSGSQNFNAEVLRLIHNMPKWIPGKNDNIPVDVRYNLNIEFKL